MIRKITLITLLFLTVSIYSQKTKVIDADNTAIDYVGRFDFSNPKEVKFNWPGAYIRFRFTGKSISLKFNGGNDGFYNVFIDDKLSVITANADTVINLASKLKKGVHTFRMYKRTEANFGICTFRGLKLDKRGKILPWDNKPSRKIMFIGNSITCGYGTEGKDKSEPFKPETENNYYSYAPITARAFNADYHCVSHSGLGIVRQYGDKKQVSDRAQMPERFEYVMDNDDTKKWNHKNWKPDLVVINLGTNDFSTRPRPDKIMFNRKYEKFVKRIKEVYDDVYVICITGPMIDEPCSSYVKEMVEDYKYLYKNQKIAYVNLPKALLNHKEDLGSSWHPSKHGQLKMSKMLAPVISTIMEWGYKFE